MRWVAALSDQPVQRKWNRNWNELQKLPDRRQKKHVKQGWNPTNSRVDRNDRKNDTESDNEMDRNDQGWLDNRHSE